MVEHLTFNQGVRSSSLRRSTTKKSNPCGCSFLWLHCGARPRVAWGPSDRAKRGSAASCGAPRPGPSRRGRGQSKPTNFKQPLRLLFFVVALRSPPTRSVGTEWDEGENATGRHFHPRSNENKELKERAMPRRATTIFAEVRAKRGSAASCGAPRPCPSRRGRGQSKPTNLKQPLRMLFFFLVLLGFPMLTFRRILAIINRYENST